MKKFKRIIYEKKFKYIIFYSFLLSTQLIIGINLQNKNLLFENKKEIIKDILFILILGIIFGTLFYTIIECIKRIRLNKKNKPKSKLKVQKFNICNKKIRLISFFIIIIAYIPEFLALGPAILNYDGPQEIYGELDAYQPLIYTFWLKFYFNLGLKIFNSSSWGMMIFSISQIIIMALIFSKAVKFINIYFNNKYITLFSILFFALFPYNKIFPLMTTKENLFAGFCLLFIMQMYELIHTMEISKKKNIEFIITTVLMLWLRKNSIYALTILVIPVIILLIKSNRELLIKIVKSIVISIIVYIITLNALIAIYNPKKDKVNEKLSSISQAIARISIERRNEITDEEKDKISYYFTDIDLLSKGYNEILADNTKYLINDIRVNQNKIDFYTFTLGLILKYPTVALKGYLNNMRGFWYIFDNSFCTIHQNEGKNANEKFGVLEMYTVKTTLDKPIFVKEWNFWPTVKSVYINLFCKNEYRKIPILYIVFQPGFYFYLLIGYLLYSIYRRSKENIIIGIFLLLYFLTCFLGPCAIIRYIYNIIVATPIMLGYIFKRKDDYEIKT